MYRDIARNDPGVTRHGRMSDLQLAVAPQNAPLLKPDVPIPDGTLGQQIYGQLERKILHGEWLPNTKVSLRTLALSLNTSMQPVREALGRLVAASALEMTPGRAFRVPSLDRQVVDEIWSLRLLLEGETAACCARRAKEIDTRQIGLHSRAVRNFLYGRDLQATMSAVMAWNTDLIMGSGSPILIDIVMRLCLRYAPFMAYALSTTAPHDEKFLQFTLHIQDELVMAIEAGDAPGARHLRCADIRSFQRYLYDRIGW